MRIRFAVVVSALALWLFAAPAAEAARSEFFGITQGPPHDAQDLQGMQDARIRTVRILLLWPDVQPTQGSFDWTRSDLVVGDLASHGIRPFPQVYGSPPWVGSGDLARPPIDSAADEQAWQDFLKAAVARYGPGGSYWANEYRQQYGTGALPLPVQSWQIWNEPNVVRWFAPAPSPQEYAELLGISHDAIKSLDPNARIVLAGLFSEGVIKPSTFLDNLYQISGARDDFDAAALHPYGCNLDQVRDVITKFRAVMENHGEGATPLWLTEFGWASGDPDQFCRNVGLTGQRDLLVSSFELILQNRTAWNVQRLYWFMWRDPAPGSPYADLCRICGTGGLLNYDRSPKPAYDAFIGFTAETTPPVASITDGPGQGSLTKDPTPTFSFASNEPGSTFACHFDAHSFHLCASPLGKPLSNGPHSFYVRAIDAPGNESAVVSRSFTVDTKPPAAPYVTDTDPNSPANYNLPRVKGQAETNSTVRLYTTVGCTGAPVAVGSAAQFASLGLGVSVADNSTTFFRATASDAAGNISACSTARVYVEDSTIPNITDTDPNSPANYNLPRVKGQAPAGTRVRLYKTVGCTGSPVATGTAAQFASPGFGVSVADNTKTLFRATARDAAGNVSPCSPARAYVEDSTAPETTITGGPSGSITDDTPTFTFASSESGSTFRCRFDSQAFAPCSGPGASHTPSTPLSLGGHSFEVRATDRAKNPDPTPAKRTFTVVTP